MADQYCSDLGIPKHLHHEDRPLVPFAETDELMFRRFNLMTESSVTACIKFSRMSVNRENFSSAEDALINTEHSGIYEGCGVVAFSVGSLLAPTANGKWQVQGVPGEYELTAEHKPGRCNYAHSEVVVFKNGMELPKIKPITVRLAIRRDLEKRIKIQLPIEQAGAQLPLGE